MPKTKEKPKVKPVHEIKLGRLVCAIWRNEFDAEGGGTVVRHNVTFSRLYKPEGEQWRNSSSFGRDDLLLLGRLVERAHAWIYEHTEEQNGSSQEHNGASAEEETHF